MPDPLAHVAGALEVEVIGGPVLPHGGALADRPGDRHLPPITFRRSGDGAVVETEVLQSIFENEAGLRLPECFAQLATAVVAVGVRRRDGPRAGCGR